ncbi:MAG: hypothetical protein WD669_02980 [Pirellulales bacterium]
MRTSGILPLRARGRKSRSSGWDLSPTGAGGNVLAMLGLARLLQLIGLAIPPLTIIAQLSGTITLGQMLGFLVVSVAVFGIGYLLQRYSSGGHA